MQATPSVTDLFGRALKKAGRIFFQTNSAAWYRKELAHESALVAPAGTQVLCTNAQGLMGWLKNESRSFPWIYIPDEIRTANMENHAFPHIIHEGEIAGYIKVAIGRAYVHDFRQIIKIPSRSAYIYDTFTLPKYRKKGLGRYLLAWTCDYLNRLGYGYLWCHIPAWNKASINLYLGSGFKEISRIRFFKVAGLSFLTREPDKLLAEAP